MWRGESRSIAPLQGPDRLPPPLERSTWSVASSLPCPAQRCPHCAARKPAKTAKIGMRGNRNRSLAGNTVNSAV